MLFPSLHGSTSRLNAHTHKSASPPALTPNIPTGSTCRFSSVMHGLRAHDPPVYVLNTPSYWLIVFLRRQTVFYTPNTLKVSDGDDITGELSCAPNARNPRDLDIIISYETPSNKKEEIKYKMCVVCFPTLACPVQFWFLVIRMYADELSGPNDRRFLPVFSQLAPHVPRILIINHCSPLRYCPTCRPCYVRLSM